MAKEEVTVVFLATTDPSIIHKEQFSMLDFWSVISRGLVLVFIFA
jgi:hypothetical protein